jgi:hypothetical protein
MPLPASKTHHRAVDRGQGAVGVLAEILVARRAKRLKARPSCTELITAPIGLGYVGFLVVGKVGD